ncbi:MAG: polysaccharide deacetylase family protein [Bacillus sp. (in: firmicutes)]
MSFKNNVRKKFAAAFVYLFVCCLYCTFSVQTAYAEASDKRPGLIPINEESRKVAYLTFDDGPSTNTIRILDILDTYNIKATFFVMANSTAVGMNGYKEMIDRGHTIALHTYSHNYNQIYVSTDEFFENIRQLETFLWDHFSLKTNVIRFPGGSRNSSSKLYGGPKIMDNIISRCDELGYRYFDWNVDSKDGISPYVSVSEITNNVLKGAEGKDKAIILLHDINVMNNTVTALPIIIKGLQKQGFTFDVISAETEEMQFR